MFLRVGKIGSASPFTGLCGCSMEQPYRANTLIVKSVGMLPGASAEIYHCP